MAKQRSEGLSFSSVRFVRVLGMILGNLMIVLGMLSLFVAVILVFIGMDQIEGEISSATYFFAAICFGVGGITLVLAGLFIEYAGRVIEKLSFQVFDLRQAKASKAAVARMTPTAAVDESGEFIPTAQRSEDDSVIVDIGLSDRLRSMAAGEADDGSTLSQEEVRGTPASDRLMDAYDPGDASDDSHHPTDRDDEGQPRQPIPDVSQETSGDRSKSDRS